MTPTLVLTRAEAQSRALAAEFAGMAPVVIAPVLDIVGTGEVVSLEGYSSAILTSANGVLFAPDLSNMRVYCVGKRTAEAARAAGADVRLVALDADDLVARIKGPGPYLHLRGEHARGDIAKRLSSAGLETHEAVIYQQKGQDLGEDIRALLEGDQAVILPLFSPRSASLVGAQIAQVGPLVHVIALSAAVSEGWRAATGGPSEVCASPTGADMRARIAAALRG